VEGNYPLCIAAECGYADIVARLLQDKRVRPSARDDYPMEIACAYGHHEVVAVLLKDGRANPRMRENKPLMEAAKNGHAEVVKLLLGVKKIDSDAGTPSYYILARYDNIVPLNLNTIFDFYSKPSISFGSRKRTHCCREDDA
jgi:ankyrin repeat protein